MTIAISTRARAHLTTLALLLVGAAGPLWYAVAQPAYSTADEMAHVDYAYQIWLGQFPDFFDGLVMETDIGTRPPLQWVSQHPPLMYAMLAPLVGPFLDADRPVMAAMLARAVFIVLAAVSVLAVRWMAQQAFGNLSSLGTVAALVYALSSWFPRQGGAIYNDLPAVFALTMAAGFLFRAIRHPRDHRAVAWLALWVALASSMRFSAIPLAFVLVVALGAHRLVIDRRPVAAVAQPVIVAMAAVAASGWWWARNAAITGNLQGSRATYWIEERGRSPRDFSEVVFSDFWHTMLQQFFSTYFLRPAEPWALPATVGIVVMFLAPLLVGIVAITIDLVRHGRAGRDVRDDMVVTTVLVTLAATIIAAQVYYSMSSGSALPRYFFAMIPFVAVMMAYGFVRWPISWWILLGWVGGRLVGTAVELMSTMDRSLAGRHADIFPGLAWSAFAVVVASSAMLVRLTWRSVDHGTSPRTADRTPSRHLDSVDRD